MNKRPETLRKLLSAKTVLLRHSIKKNKSNNKSRTKSRASPVKADSINKKDRISLKTVSSLTNIIPSSEETLCDYLVIPAQSNFETPTKKARDSYQQVEEAEKEKKSKQNLKL